MSIIIIGSGCAKARKGSDVKNGDEVEKLLSSATVSAKLTSDPERLKACDEEKVMATFDGGVTLSEANAEELWNACQSVYACSPSAKSFIQRAFESDATFQLGFADLSPLGTGAIKGRMRALYVWKTGKIFIDTRVSKVEEACSLLLHELVHRFDESSTDGSGSLKVEYRAYWYQEAFAQDLYLRGDKISGAYKKIARRTTKKTLLTEVAATYGYEVNQSILDRYEPLPFEIMATDF